MRTYLMLREKAQRFQRDPEIQIALQDAQVAELDVATSPDGLGAAAIAGLRSRSYDIDALSRQGYATERLDQLVTELLLGVR